ncbi:MAG: lysoplasmalogenase, partial [Flammeovirgaceae bacterium]
MMKNVFLYLFFVVSGLELLFLVIWPEAHFVSKPLIMLSLLGYYLSHAECRSNLFVAALLFCWLGDVLLLFSAESFFIFGLVAFLTGHVLYIVTYLQHRSADRSKELMGPQKARFAFPLILLGTGLVTILYPKLGGMKIPVMVYATVITVMSITALFRYGRTTSK